MQVEPPAHPQPTASAHDNFLAVLKQKRRAPDTIAAYDYYLKYFARKVGRNINDLGRGDRLELEEMIKKVYLSVSHPQAVKIGNALAIYYSANRIVIDWKYVNGFKPAPPDYTLEDKPYTRAMIQTLIKEANGRTALAIYCMATAGLRVGALTSIRGQDLIYIEPHNLYAITVYPNTRAQYLAFLTPQASQLMAEIAGKQPPTEPIFTNIKTPGKPVKRIALMLAIWRLIVKTGLRQPGDRLERKEIQMDHGFRKFYRTSLENAGIKEEHAEKLMDHGPKLVRTYAKPAPIDWLNTSEYLKAVPALTF